MRSPGSIKSSTYPRRIGLWPSQISRRLRNTITSTSRRRHGASSAFTRSAAGRRPPPSGAAKRKRGELKERRGDPQARARRTGRLDSNSARIARDEAARRSRATAEAARSPRLLLALATTGIPSKASSEAGRQPRARQGGETVPGSDGCLRGKVAASPAPPAVLVAPRRLPSPARALTLRDARAAIDDATDPLRGSGRSASRRGCVKPPGEESFPPEQHAPVRSTNRARRTESRLRHQSLALQILHQRIDRFLRDFRQILYFLDPQCTRVGDGLQHKADTDRSHRQR